VAEINFMAIFDGVTLALHSAFPAANIHGGAVGQDLHPGDFCVVPVAPRHTAAMGKRAKQSIVFDVIYYPTETGGRAECLGIAHTLAGILETITTPNGDKAHCYKQESTIEDDVLHCSVSYTYFAYTASENTPMETLSLN